jgi:hypothetical protein
MTNPVTPPLGLAMHFRGVPLIPPLDCTDPQSWIAEQIYQMGADQELKECVGSLAIGDDRQALQTYRRPKPPTLKEQALEDLRILELLLKEHKMVACTFNIRRALEVQP